MKATIATLVLVLMARAASAQPGNTPPIQDLEPPPQQSVAPPTGEDKSESTAFWLSFGGTVGSYALWIGAASSRNTEIAPALAGIGLTGTLLAPTFGHWYAGKGFTRGFGLRLGGIGVGFVGLLAAISGCSLFGGGHDSEHDSECGNPELGVALLVIAGGMWVGGTVDDIIQAPRRVARQNEARGYAVTPLMSKDAAGLAFAGTF